MPVSWTSWIVSDSLDIFVEVGFETSTLGPKVVFFSTPPYHGTLTRFHAHPAAWLHKLPDNVSYEEGSVCEPLAVALAGIERAGIKLGDPVVIWSVEIPV